MAATTLLVREAAPDSALSAPARPEIAASKGWDVYLVLAALLVPVLKPTIPVLQATLVDALNAIALLVFGAIALARRPRLQMPLVVPAIVITIGSLVAITNAESVTKCAITLIQDAYLYAWFLALVAILAPRGDQRGMRIGWMWSANIAGGIALTLLLTNGITTFWMIFGPKGWRAVGLFDGPNSLADFMMVSLFVTVSLMGQANRFLVVGSLLFQLLVLVATKSIGAMSGWMLGMVVFAFLRLLTRLGSLFGTLAITALLGGTLLLGWWMGTEWGVGGHIVADFKQRSAMGRLDKSAEGREVIWHRLIERYAESPLGIGPGNSSEQKLSIGHSERRTSQRSKEAHNDYLGYLVERGPLGLLGLLMLVVLPFTAVWKGFRKVADRRWRAGAGGVLAAALAGGLVATAFHSLTMEKLHFRHYWTFLALVYAFSAASAPRLVAAAASRRSHSRRRRAARPASSHASPSLGRSAGPLPEMP